MFATPPVCAWAWRTWGAMSPRGRVTAAQGGMTWRDEGGSKRQEVTYHQSSASPLKRCGRSPLTIRCPSRRPRAAPKRLAHPALPRAARQRRMPPFLAHRACAAPARRACVSNWPRAQATAIGGHRGNRPPSHTHVSRSPPPPVPRASSRHARSRRHPRCSSAGRLVRVGPPRISCHDATVHARRRRNLSARWSSPSPS